MTEVKPFESWRYDAVGKPLWSHATGWTRLEPIADGRTRAHFTEEYEAFKPIMRVLFEKRVHEGFRATTTRSSPPSTAASPGTAGASEAGRPQAAGRGNPRAKRADRETP